MDPTSLPRHVYRFADANPEYNVEEDVWGLVQDKGHLPIHHHPEGLGKHRTKPVREECILA